MERSTKNSPVKVKASYVVMIICLMATMATTMMLVLSHGSCPTDSAKRSKDLPNRNLQELKKEKEKVKESSHEESSKADADAKSSKVDADAIHLSPFDEDTLALTILPNELPGYTGWARPTHTLVDFFRVKGFSSPHATVGKDWSVKLECKHSACLKGGSLFYVRAYGRSILPGRVVDHENGKYTVTILPHDAGRYTLEVVLTCSQRPDWEKLPSAGKPGEPSYEGYLVPGFPLQFTVKENQSKMVAQKKRRLDSQLPVCTAQQLIETSTDSAVAWGRWLVVNKTRSFAYTPRENTVSFERTEKINIETYTRGDASVGFQMEYFPMECSLLTIEQLNDRKVWLSAMDKQPHFRGKSVHVLFIGDSNTRNQFNYMRDHIALPGKTEKLGGRLRLTYVDMMGHWPETFPKTRDKLDEIKAKYKDDLFILIFNVGLHEVTNRCTIQGIRKGYKVEGLCHEVYKNDVKELVEVIQKFPGVLKVWQSTTAGWPKWGVHGIAWPQALGQKVPKEPNFCEYLNHLAWDIISEAKIPVMDTYWLTVSRADHREVVEREVTRTSYKLVHLGPEVYSILVRKFCMMILEAIEKGKEGQVYL